MAPSAAVVAPSVAPRAPRKSNARDARALQWVVSHLARDLPAEADAPPARRFAAKLLADIEASTTVSNVVKRHAAAIARALRPFHYLEQLAAPEEAIANPLLHYVMAGWREGLSPSPLFAPDFYRHRRGAIAGDPLLDFVRDGAKLAVDPHPLFDVAFYRERHLAGDAEINPLAHYLRDRRPPAARSLAAVRHAPVSRNIRARRGDRRAARSLPRRSRLARFSTDARLRRAALSLSDRNRTWRKARSSRRSSIISRAAGATRRYCRICCSIRPSIAKHNKLEFDGPALTHYLSEGEAKGLPCHPLFSPTYYNEQRGEADASVGALAHALALSRRAIAATRAWTIRIDPRMFALVRQLLAENGVEDFHLDVYRDANPDIASLGDEALEAHWRKVGVVERRLASLTQMMRISGLRVRDLPVGFVLDDYVSIYQDLKRVQEPVHQRAAITGADTAGRSGGSSANGCSRSPVSTSICRPQARRCVVAPRAERLDVCILIHVFYPDLLAELVAFAQNFRNVSFDIFINLVDISWTPELQEQVRAICPGAFVMLSHDAGRDVGGFTRLLENVDIARYDLFAFMHSKKSPHIAPESGEYWRRAPVADDRRNARDRGGMREGFPRESANRPDWRAEWRSQDMGKNVEQYERLLDLLGVRGKNRELDYVSGFMFLIRSEVVARLFDTLRQTRFRVWRRQGSRTFTLTDKSPMASSAQFQRWSDKWAMKWIIGSLRWRSLFAIHEASRTGAPRIGAQIARELAQGRSS